MTEDRKAVLKGSKEIGSLLGISPKELPSYVETMGLPAFKIGNRSRWMALRPDLMDWVREQRDFFQRNR